MFTFLKKNISKVENKLRIVNIKVFPEGLMVDIALKNISSCTVSYIVPVNENELHFQPTLP